MLYTGKTFTTNAIIDLMLKGNNDLIVTIVNFETFEKVKIYQENFDNNYPYRFINLVKNYYYDLCENFDPRRVHISYREMEHELYIWAQ